MLIPKAPARDRRSVLVGTLDNVGIEAHHHTANPATVTLSPQFVAQETRSPAAGKRQTQHVKTTTNVTNGTAGRKPLPKSDISFGPYSDNLSETQ